MIEVEYTVLSGVNVEDSFVIDKVKLLTGWNKILSKQQDELQQKYDDLQKEYIKLQSDYQTLFQLKSPSVLKIKDHTGKLILTVNKDVLSQHSEYFNALFSRWETTDQYIIPTHMNPTYFRKMINIARNREYKLTETQQIIVSDYANYFGIDLKKGKLPELQITIAKTYTKSFTIRTSIKNFKRVLIGTRLPFTYLYGSYIIFYVSINNIKVGISFVRMFQTDDPNKSIFIMNDDFCKIHTDISEETEIGFEFTGNEVEWCRVVYSVCV